MFPPKELTDFEKQTAVQIGIHTKDLEKDNLTMDAIAKAKLISQLKTQAETVAKHMQQPDNEKNEVIDEYEHYNSYHKPVEGRTQKDVRKMRTKMRKIALSDDIENLSDVEKNFDERRERKKAA